MVLILLLFLPAAVAQQTAVSDPGTPGIGAARPLPRKLAGREPALILKGLLGSGETHHEALQLLALDPGSQVNSARLVSAQLDQDPEIEMILVIDLGTSTA